MSAPGTSASGRARRRWRRRWRRLGFSLIPAVALLLLGEVVARQAGVLVGGGPGGWTLTPGLDGYEIKQRPPMVDFTVSTNEDGLRTAYGRERAPGTRRLLVFGDSTVFGWGLPPEGSPAGVLEAALGEGWEVVNAGQPGFSSEQARRLAEALLPLYEPDGVVWFHPWHDVSEVKVADRELLPDEPAWWLQSALLSWLAAPSREERSDTEMPFAPFAADHTADGVKRVPEGERRENLERVAEAAGDAGAWLVVALLPTDTTLGVTRPSPLARELQPVCEALGVAFVDTGATMVGRTVSEVTLPGDPGHFTAAANALLLAPVLDAISSSASGRERP